MDITNSVLKRFTDFHQKLFSAVSVGDGHRLILNGSFPHTVWAGDVDLYQPLPPAYLPRVCLMLEVLIGEALHDDPRLYFDALKIGDSKFTTPNTAIRALKRTIPHKSLYSSKWGRDWIKLDLLVVVKGYLEEISVVYDLTPSSFPGKTPAQVRKSLREDSHKFAKEGRLYKSLKRLSGATSNTKMTARIDKTLANPAAGFLYLTISRLRSLQTTKVPTDVRKHALGLLREDVKVRLGLLPRTNFTLTNLPHITQSLQTVLNHRLDSLTQLVL